MSQPDAIFYTASHCPIGPITLAATDKGICHIAFGSGEAVLPYIKQWAKKRLDCVQLIQQKTPLLEQAMQELDQYFRGERTTFTVPLDIHGTEFQQKVWRQLLEIPYGQVRSYKEIAEAIGSPKAVRAVGGANNKNPLSLMVPCHRVIGSNGALVGYGGGLGIKQFLLRLENLQ